MQLEIYASWLSLAIGISVKVVSITGHRHILILLTALFGFRVIAQFASIFITDGWIPPFERWSSGVIPYPLLLVSQLLILALMISGSSHQARWWPGSPAIRAMKWLALGYFSIMFCRLIVALGGISSSPWWQLTLPPLFHLVLATYLYCYSEYHNKLSRTGGGSA